MKQTFRPVERSAALNGISRRSFLLLAGLAGAGLLTGCAPPDDAGSATETETWSAWLLAGGDNRDAVVRLGQAYLQARPDERDRHALLSQVDAALAVQLPGDGQGQTTAAAGEALQTVVCDDYAAGDIVMVSGWILSRTEARAYALVALMSRA